MKQLCNTEIFGKNIFDITISVRGNDGLDFMRSDKDAMAQVNSANIKRDNCIHKRC